MKKEKKLNNRGFTLIEVLAVIVILVIIVAIAIPNISASLDRQKCKLIENKMELFKSTAQFYVSDHKNEIKEKLSSDKAPTLIVKDEDGMEMEKKYCLIGIKNRLENEGYITAQDREDIDGDDMRAYIIYFEDNTYDYIIYTKHYTDKCNLNKYQVDNENVFDCAKSRENNNQ